MACFAIVLFAAPRFGYHCVYDYPNVSFDTILSNVILFIIGMNAKSVVSIELLDSGRYDLCGFVEKFDDEECTIFLVDEYGYSDGYAHIDVADVTAISCDSGCEKIIAKLYANVSEKVKI